MPIGRPALLRFAAVGGEFRPWRLRPYRLGRARPVAAGTRRGLPPSRRFMVRDLRRPPPWLGGALQRLVRGRFHDPAPSPRPSSDPRRHPCVAGPIVARRLCAFRAGRPGRDASPEVCFPTAHAGHAAPSGAANLRTIPLRRSGPIPSPPWREHSIAGRPTGLRPCGFTPGVERQSLGRPRRPRTIVVEARTLRLGRRPIRVMHRLIFRSNGGVPLPAVGCFVAWPEFVACSTALRPCDTAAPSGGAHGIRPSQCFSCPRDRSVFRPGLPPAVFRTFHPGLFSRGAGRRCSVESLAAGRGRPPRLLGLVPAGNPFRRLLAEISAAETALGFVLSQVCGTPVRARPRGNPRRPTASVPRFRGLSARGLGAKHSGVRRDHALAARAAPRTRTVECSGRGETVNAFQLSAATSLWAPRGPEQTPAHAERTIRRPFSVLRGCCLADPTGGDSYVRGLRPCVPPRPRGDRQPV